MTRDEAWHRFVEDYDIEVSPEAIENERRLIELDIRHRMQYDRLTGGDAHVFPSQELADQEEELTRAATFEAKEPLVLRALQEQLQLTVTDEELEAEAAALAERNGTSPEAVRGFFGDDLSMLRRDVLRRKAIDWALDHAESGH
jgi:FKBP-type peptidyl-prolyl cis-trans isomerase (trigger factor)